MAALDTQAVPAKSVRRLQVLLAVTTLLLSSVLDVVEGCANDGKRVVDLSGYGVYDIRSLAACRAMSSVLSRLVTPAQPLSI
jgi:hypothetical protein